MVKKGRDLQALKRLLMLLDAESEDVRNKVRHELHAWGEDLDQLLNQAGSSWSPEEQFWLHEITQERAQLLVRHGWMDWLDHPDPYRQLETGFTTLAQLQNEIQIETPLPQLLDDLCDQFLSLGAESTPANLNQFLFVDGRLGGAVENYYHPTHSHLPHVILHGQGLPLSLAIIFMLVGYRLDINILGLNLPGHFLTRTELSPELEFFDCFNQGRVLKEHEIFSLALSPQIPFEQLLKNPPSPPAMVMRALMNLIHAYQHIGNHQQFHFMQDLLADLYQRTSPDKHTRELIQDKDRPLLECGQLVRHKRYDYRGVVVDFDLTCQAQEAWYRSNLTQPDKNQPWYHVLVDGSESTTYAAQTNLEPDPSLQAIHHPLIPIYFDKFEDGRYKRNQVPWKLELL